MVIVVRAAAVHQHRAVERTVGEQVWLYVHSAANLHIAQVRGLRRRREAEAGLAHGSGVALEAAFAHHRLHAGAQVQRPAVLQSESAVLVGGTTHADAARGARTAVAVLAWKAQALIATRLVLAIVSIAPPLLCARAFERLRRLLGAEWSVRCAQTRGCGGTRSRRSSSARRVCTRTPHRRSVRG